MTQIDLPADDSLNFKDLLNVIRRRRTVIILVFAVIVIIVTIGSFIMTPVYKATATLLVDPESPNLLTTTGTISMESQSYLSYQEYNKSQIEILTSYSLIKKVFDEFKLGSAQKYKNSKEPIKDFLKTVSVTPVRDTRIIKLSVDNEDPELAAKITNRIATLYVMRNLYYISKNELANLFKNEYLKLESKLSEYSKIYKEGHPEMIKLRKEMSDLTNDVEQEKKSTCNYDQIENYLSRGSGRPLSGFKANNIIIQDPAVTPIVPFKPKKLTYILLSMICGSISGFCIAILIEHLDDTAKTVEDIEKITNWPFLASIPNIDKSGKIAANDKDRFVHTNPKDPVSEVYRIVRTRILFSSTDDHHITSLLVTSPGPQEGKTTTLCNLGIAISQNDKKVLIVDADMRKPRLHDVFNGTNDIGLSSILTGQTSMNAVIRDSEIEGVSYISAGVIPPNPSELLNSKVMKEFIIEAKKKFDFVLIDTPPIAMLTDAVIISGFVDGVVIVIESGKTGRGMLTRIHQRLDHAKARVLGMVLNKASIIGNDYYYDYYYGKTK